MIQLLKSEQVFFSGNKDDAYEIFRRVSERIFLKYKTTKYATAGGYIRKNELILAVYNGRYGTGISVFENGDSSTRYCNKTYILYDIDYKELRAIVETVTRRDLEEGDYKWQ